MPNSKSEAKEHAALAARQLTHATKNAVEATDIVKDVAVDRIRGGGTGIEFSVSMSRNTVLAAVGAMTTFVVYRRFKPVYDAWRLDKAADKAQVTE
jgi:hypothetical protein